MGKELKKVLCSSPKTKCQECMLQSVCLYIQIFEPFSRGKFLKSKKAPPPFILEFDMDDKVFYKAGEKFSFNLILIGQITQYIPYYIYAVENMGETGLGRRKNKLKLTHVVDSFSDKIVFDKEKFKENFTQLDLRKYFSDNSNTKNLKINFETPLRIKHQRKYATSVDFTTLLTNILRRIALINENYWKEDLPYDYKDLIEKSENIPFFNSELKWHDWIRYSSRQKAKMKLGGLIGSIKFKGKLNEFIPLLKIGEVIHVGKNTSFGLGKYTMEYI